MSPVQRRPDVPSILNQLKDFQRNTVDYVFHRLYTDSDRTNRFLIADEVGLGKTLVARGVIARSVDHLWDKVKRIDIVYICSNGDIARQNIDRLKITNDEDFALSSRLTLLPTRLKDLNANKINFVSFTPGTSFDLRSRTGVSEERVLLHTLLAQAWGFQSQEKAPINVLRVDVDAERFQARVNEFDPTKIDQSLATAFADALRQKPDLRKRFNELCETYSRSKAHVSQEERKRRSAFVGDLRKLLAKTCLKSLEPRLIILDEFQRFKNLLENEDEASLLAQELFNSAGTDVQDVSARVLLLSATPYKMYTLVDEEENHYADFLKTFAFLQPDKSKQVQFEKLLNNYRREIYRLHQGEGQQQAIELKSYLQEQLLRVIVRTEKLAVTEERDGMLEIIPPKARLESQDLESYIALEQISSLLGGNSCLEYWKSAPYLFNFMNKESYKFKRDFLIQGKDLTCGSQIAQVIKETKPLTLPWRSIEAYQAVDPGNARLRALKEDTLDVGAWQLLWVPPSLPYYKLDGPYSDPNLARFTKRLVFSSWRVVPDVITMLLSYEAERLSVRRYDKSIRNSPEQRRRRRPLLRFSLSDGRPAGMSVLAMIYPCSTLATRFDPRNLVLHENQEADIPTKEQLIERYTHKIEEQLRGLRVKENKGGPNDEQWYWASPILLDLKYARGTRAWFDREDLSVKWSGSEDQETSEDEDSVNVNSWWDSHLDRVNELVKRYMEGSLSLGPRPADLSRVLAQMALGGLGVTALRAISRVTGGVGAINNPDIRDRAAQMSKSFLSLMNSPETIALIRGMNRTEPYWRRVLDYCVDGCLQSVLDEYVHVLPEFLGIANEVYPEKARRITEAISDVVTLRTSVLAADEIKTTTYTAYATQQRLRGRFALRFGDEQSDVNDQVTRADQVRRAFNSPFWPFVLATTSIGQEGLDFHLYCHAVVHWNLPSNPVDLEQREGRVHRYKGHAVRQNLAKKWGISALAERHVDVWQTLFELGKRNRKPGISELEPYWVYPVDGGAKIERYVLALPLSREEGKIDILRRSLAVYRMVFGQIRQDDLLMYLLNTLNEKDIAITAKKLWIDLSPPARSKQDDTNNADANSSTLI